MYVYLIHGGFPGSSGGKESACTAGVLDSIPRSGKSPGKGKSHPTPVLLLENSMDRGASQARVHRVAWSQT